MGEKYFHSYRLTLGLIGHFRHPNFGHRHEDHGITRFMSKLGDSATHQPI